MNAKQRDELLAHLEALDRRSDSLPGAPMVPLHRDTFKQIIAALHRAKALEDGE